MVGGAVVVAVLLIAFAVGEAQGQQITAGTPASSIGESFFEQTGVSWGLRGRGFSLSFGAPNLAAPGFGGFDPNAGLNGGFAFGGNGIDGVFNFSAGQGYRQSFTTQSPMMTLTPGYPGFFADASLSPFVIGYVPVVGGFPTVPYPYQATAFPGVMLPGYGGAVGASSALSERVQMLRERPAGAALASGRQAKAGGKGLKAEGGGGQAEAVEANAASSAARAAPSVAEAKRLWQKEQLAGDREAERLFELGRAAEETGKKGAARVYYGMAAKKARGDLRQQIESRLATIKTVDRP